jgi:hypothetical protein
MSSRNSHGAKATRRTAPQAASGSRGELRDPAIVALEIARTVLYAESGTDLTEVRRLLPDSTPLDFVRKVLLHAGALAAASAISEAAQAGITPGAYLDDLIRRRPGGGHGGR